MSFVSGQAVTQSSKPTLVQLLREALITGDHASFEALGNEGPIAVECFRAWLAGELRREFPRVDDPRTFMDNATETACVLASRFPDVFLRTFNSSRWAEHSEVLIGLGYTGREEAVPLLCQVLRDGAWWGNRIAAAISLGRLPSNRDSIVALMEGIEDVESLVQHHSMRSLGQIGDHAALDWLLAIAAEPPSYGNAIAAPEAAANLARRLGVCVDIPKPDLSRWPPRNQRRAREEDG